MGYQQQSVNYRLCVFFGFQPSLIFILDEKPLANAGRFLLGRDYFGTGGSAVYLFRPTHMYDLGTIGEPSAAAAPYRCLDLGLPALPPASSSAPPSLKPDIAASSVPLTPAGERPIRFEDRSQQQVHHTTCYMCACRCGIKVTTEERPGEPGQPCKTHVRFIQGNPNHVVNQGVLCAKGSAGIMKQYSKAKLQHPMIRRPGSERGDGVYDPISWDDALDLLSKRLAHIRATDPKKLAFFTGRDQMQALTGLWAQQFGTPNWAAHGGFCSVNMAAAGLYSIGYSFWEFGAPDWDRAKYFVLWGVAEDHSSNPIKIGLDKLKTRGAKFVSVNPVRTCYIAIAD